MIVVKFGGSSLAGPERMLAAARIVARHSLTEPVVCVVSAMAGVTDQLFAIATLAVRGQSDWQALYASLRAQHEHTLAALASPGSDMETAQLAPLCRMMESDIVALAAKPEGREREEAIAVFSAWGEKLSVRLFAAAMAHAGIEATLFEDAPVIVEHDLRRASPRWIASVAATSLWLRDPITNLMRRGKTPVLPGYLALTQDGAYTTLGRNGSDHSAAIIGAALDAHAVYMYSDVAGIYEADPRVMPGARLLASLTYGEAAAIATRGARVLHPASLLPLAQRGIQLYLRSAFDPEAPGTDIGMFGDSCPPPPRLDTTPLGALLASLALAGTQRKVGRPDAF
ncbi:MAG TPA: aspartate kinase [Ktedonobacterales bacterium]|nr:aspartate kinase [Ktedonobacterales bacterium]